MNTNGENGSFILLAILKRIKRRKYPGARGFVLLKELK